MHILCIGLNHRTAAVDLREKMAISEHQARVALSRLGCGNLKIGSLSEMAILSTCNRVEVYAAGPDLDFLALEQFLSEIHGLGSEVFAPSMYKLADEDAVRHLFHVAAGLDSLVVGEPQILGQVTQAFGLARSQNSMGKVLSRLFQSAIHTGKRARTETAIARNPASVASIAVHLTENIVGELAAARVVLVGAGEMAEGTLQALVKRGVHRVTVINRTIERARELANRWMGEPATFESLPGALASADILISSTSAPHTLIHPVDVLAAMQQRSRPLVIIDIAVPRDVDEEVRLIPNVRLFDMDGLQDYLEQSVELRAQEIPLVEKIIQEEIEAFSAFLQTLDVLPIIADLRQKAEEIRQRELEKTLRKLSNLSPAEIAALEAMTTAMVKKLLHDPIQALREQAGGPQVSEFTTVTRSLFRLDNNLMTESIPRQPDYSDVSSSSGI
jgi:glutamyl-tRNA reductase